MHELHPIHLNYIQYNLGTSIYLTNYNCSTKMYDSLNKAVLDWLGALIVTPVGYTTEIASESIPGPEVKRLRS
jgi:hypothetical protein